MYKISRLKLGSAIIVTMLALLLVVPNFLSDKPSWIPSDKVNLGLDLRGGSHLLLDVEFASYLEDLTQSLADGVRQQLRDNKIGYRNFQVMPNKLSLVLRNKEDYNSVRKLIAKVDGNLSIGNDDGKVTFGYDQYQLNLIKDKVIEQSIEIIRMRVDSTGTKEPIIQRQGNDHILLQVPGEEDPMNLKKALGQTAKLTFHLVDEATSVTKALAGQLPRDAKILHFAGDNNAALVVKKKIIVSGDQLNNAQAAVNNDAIPVVHFSFNSLGGKKFAEATTQNRGKRLAIVLDGKILSAPVINNPILGGSGIISGNFTFESASELALLLRAGALPAPLKPIEERSIGPNLGADSIESGKKAATIAFGLVTFFMLLFYGILGIFANLSLVIALVYIFALLSLLQATLTLPGIAGIILTIGMAVDANVLIYERIREEVENGASNLYAVKIGFASAFDTITDSNVTTLFAAFLLYSFGVGAIKGFAVTLTIGIISSMFAALVITKLLIDLWLKYFNPKTLGL